MLYIYNYYTLVLLDSTTHKMKNTFWIFSLAMLLFSTFTPSFTYADSWDNELAIEILTNTLSEMDNNYWNTIVQNESVENEMNIYSFEPESDEVTIIITWDDSTRNTFRYKKIKIWDYIIMDRNLWAKKARDWTSFDDNSENYDSVNDYYWYYYQRWNNYWFSAKTNEWIDWSITVSEEQMPSKFTNSSWIQTNPWDNWNALNNWNYNLWWSTESTDSSKQWPCPTWWHVPTSTEWTNIYNYWRNSDEKTTTFNESYKNISVDLKIPFAGIRNYNDLTFKRRWTRWYLRASTQNSNKTSNHFQLYDRWIYTNSSINRSDWLPVRCIKDFIDNDNYKFYELDDWSYKIVEYKWNLWNDIIIPEKINWHTVKQIGENVFKGRNLTTVELPDSIEVIGTWAFQSNIFTGDFTFNFPSNLKIIWANAFEKSGLSWNNWLPDWLEYIWEYAFSNFSPSVKWKPTHITDLIIPDTVKYIWWYAFNTNPINTVTIWKSVEYIWDYAFQHVGSYYPSTIEEVIIPDSLKELWMWAFQSNKNLKKIIIWSWNWELIIRANAFDNCKIRELEINKEKIKLESYNTYRGSNYNPYEKIRITAKEVTRNLENIKLLSSNQNWVFADMVLNVPEEDWILDDNWRWSIYLKSLTLDPSIKEVSNSVFRYHYTTWLIIPWTIKIITNNAFENINYWYNTTLVLEDWIEVIGTWAFINNYELANISLPNTLKKIWYQAFYNASNRLTDVIIPNSVTKIWNEAFKNAWHLWTVVLNEWLEEIWTWAFYLTNIESINIPDSVKYIWDDAFCWKNWITSVYLVNNIEPENYDPNCAQYIRQYQVKYTWDVEDFRYPEKEILNLNDKAIKPNIENKNWYEFLWWYEKGATEPFDFDNTQISENKILYWKWKSLEEKAEKSTTENVVYTNNTTVTVWDETTEEVLSWSTTLSLVAEEVKQQEVTKEEDKTTVKETEIKVTSDKKVEYEWWLEVYLEKTETVGTDIVATGKVEWTIKFSAPIAVKIPVASKAKYVKVQVKHWNEEFWFKWLTLNPVNECDGWEAVNYRYNWEDVEVKGNNWERYATIYTCSASIFIAYTESTKPTILQPSRWMWRPINQEIKVTEEEHNSADTKEVFVEEKRDSTTNETVEQKVKKVEWKSLTRWEVAVMTNILLDVYPQLAEKKTLNEVSEACENYVDEQDFTKDEKKAITRLCKLSIMWIHNDNKEPLDEFLAKQKASNWEFATVMDRVVSNYNEKDLSTIKEALNKLEWDEEWVVFGTVYNVFMSIKNIFQK